MQIAENIRRAFPNDWARIVALRKSHPSLEEMCADLERLSLDVSQAMSGQKQMSEALRNDYLSTITDLKQEILEWLSVHPSAPVDHER